MSTILSRLGDSFIVLKPYSPNGDTIREIILIETTTPSAVLLCILIIHVLSTGSSKTQLQKLRRDDVRHNRGEGELE